MSSIEFSYHGVNTLIQCNPNDKFSSILNKLATKTDIDFNSVYILYSGNMIKDKELSFNQIANASDKARNKMAIAIVDSEDKDNDSYIKSEQIICPECKESIRISIDNYKIKLYDCVNNHKMNNISLEEFDDTQKINQTKIICDDCQKGNKATSYKNTFYRCNICKQNLCPMCKNKHDKKHILINYDEINYICKIHNEAYTFYCETCKKNICISCEGEHADHSVFSFGKIMPNKDYIFEKLKYMRNTIDLLGDDINNMIDRLNKVKENIEKLFNIIDSIINHYNNNFKNYEILQNLNEIEKNFSFDDIDEIVKNKNVCDKFKYIMNIYNKMLPFNELRITYNIANKKDKIKIFGADFVKNNKNICNIIYDDQTYELSEYFDIQKTRNDRLELRLKGLMNVRNMSGMFMCCESLVSLGDIYDVEDIYYNIDSFTDITKWNTSKITDISWLFMGCISLVSLPDISEWNTKNIKDMKCLFYQCSSLRSIPDISKWNITKITELTGIFTGCSSLKTLPDISIWDTKNITKMDEMFTQCSSLISLPNISKWNTDNVINMESLFHLCSSLTSLPDISGWNMSKLSNISSLFYQCSSLASFPHI